MKLQQVTLQGFKSFADTTVFDFEHDFTAVVGPNGSGKSNIADAIRWVLGEQSMKLLRAKSQADLIFGGSKELSRLGRAHVAMHFDNSDRQFPVDYGEVVISRTLFRNGESEYLLNNAPVRLQDIVMMLAQANFGQKSYAVIGQGMITDFLNATPQERKIFFDEATGVREFQIKRDQAINKLIRAEENMIQTEAVIVEITPHLASLKRQVDRLHKREKIEEELRIVQHLYYGSVWYALTQERNTFQQQYEKKMEDVHRLEKEMAQLQEQNDVIASESSRTQRYETLQQQYTALQEKKSALVRDHALLKAKLEMEHQKQGELSLVWIERKVDEIEKDIQQHLARIEQLENQRTHAQSEHARYTAEYEALEKDTDAQKKQIVDLQAQIAKETQTMTMPDIQRTLQELFDQQESFIRDLLQTQSLDAFRALQKTGKNILKRFASFMDRLMSNEKGVSDVLTVELQRMQETITQLSAERTRVQEELNRIAIENSVCQKEIDLHSAQCTRLEGEHKTIIKEKEAATHQRSGTAKEAEAIILAQVDEYQQRIDTLDTDAQKIRVQIDAFHTQEEEKKMQLVTVQSEMRSVQRHMTTARQEVSTIEIGRARVETRIEDTRATIEREVDDALHQDIFSYHDTAVVETTALQKQMSSLRKQLEAIGTIDETTVQEYNDTQERYDFLSTQMQDVEKTIASLDTLIDELDETIRIQFSRNFKKINQGFSDYFSMLFDGGNAKLIMLTETEVAPETDQENAVDAGNNTADATQEISEGEKQARELIGKKKKKQKIISGIDVIASPPRKKVGHIQSLSGGEKSLVAIALLCSIIANNPAPFVVLDEVEAALDEENSEKLAAILKALSKKTQLIVVTHNRVTMRAADVLYGVTVGLEGKSHILSVKLEDAEEMVEENS